MAFPNSYPALNPVDIYREHISDILGPIAGVEPSLVFQRLQWTQTQERGDLILPVPALQIKGKKPQEIALEISEKFPPSALVEKPVVMETFLQFFFKLETLTKTVISSVLKNQAMYGANPNLGLVDPSKPSKGKKKLVVEFSSPNIAKKFHAGHLRSTIIGGFIAKLYTALGWDVVKMNYLGDWGKQYGLLANGFRKYGSEEDLTKDPINHLFEVYVKINSDSAAQEAPIKELQESIKVKKAAGVDISELERDLQGLVEVSEDEKARRYFRSMEDGDEEALALWRRFRELSISKYKETYARLNIDFDEYAGESKVSAQSIASVATELAEQNISEVSDGAIIVDFAKHGAKKLDKAIFQRRDGTPLYLTRDLAEIRARHSKHFFDKMIYVVAAAQDIHLTRVFKLTELSGHKEIADKCQHINFGMVRGMSTRKGNVTFLDDILRDVGDKMHEVMRKNEKKYEQIEHPEQVADTLGITAVMVQDMTGKRINGYDFNLEAMTSFEGDTGPYLQYAHARLCSIERKSEVDMSKLSSANLSLLKEQHASDLVRLLAQWPDVVQNTAKTHEPMTVLTYLFKMTHVLSSSYDVLKVVGSEPELKLARMTLYAAARQVLHNGMSLLGLSPVERYVLLFCLFLTSIWLSIPD
jgi:arginyl-tRNA synthetase